METTYPVKHLEGGMPPVSRKSKYPFSSMGIEDYFEVPVECKAISSIAFAYGKSHGTKFSIRKDGDKFKVIRVK